MNTKQKEVLKAEQLVTQSIENHGINSIQYKDALDNFKFKWLSLINKKENLNLTIKSNN